MMLTFVPLENLALDARHAEVLRCRCDLPPKALARANSTSISFASPCMGSCPWLRWDSQLVAAAVRPGKTVAEHKTAEDCGRDHETSAAANCLARHGPLASHALGATAAVGNSPKLRPSYHLHHRGESRSRREEQQTEEDVYSDPTHSHADRGKKNLSSVCSMGTQP